MSELYCSLFETGADLLLDREWKREPWTQHENYDSLDSDFCSLAEAEDRLREHVRDGFAELVPQEPSCVHPLGAVRAEGAKKFRLIMDCTASGLNACIRTTAMALPTVRDVMRGSRVGSFAAKYDLKDGFFHVKVAPAFADMLGFRMPLSGEWARYRVIVFGGKSSPFIFCGTQ